MKGRAIELLVFDIENKVDLAAAKARRWFNVDGVERVTDIPTSGIAIAASNIVRDKKEIALITNAGTSDLRGKECSPYSVHWNYDTYALAAGTAHAHVRGCGTSCHFCFCGALVWRST